MADERSDFANYLRSLRKRRELTLRELGTAAGIDFTYLSKIENDQVSVPSVDAIHRLARALEASRSDINRLIALSDELRKNPIAVGAGQAPEEAMLLRRIYSGGVTRSQFRRMLEIAERPKKPAR